MTDLNPLHWFPSWPSDITLGQPQYDFAYRVYPSDLAADGSYYQHYMVININRTEGSNFDNHITGQQGNINTYRVLGNELSKTDTLRYNIDPSYKGANGQLLGATQAGGFFNNFTARQTRRIVESIALYMPPTMIFTSQAEYTDISLTALAAGAVSSGFDGVAGFQRGATAGGGVGGLLGGVLGFVGGLFGSIGQGLQVGKMPLNPKVEILFKTTPQRQFQFDFFFAPENEQESATVDQIYRTLSFHQAPEFNTGYASYVLPLWTSPSEFDITFYHAGKENLKIPRINTCVLETVDYDVAPRGVFAAFSNGYPVAYRMTLRFRELEVRSKLRVAQGF